VQQYFLTIITIYISPDTSIILTSNIFYIISCDVISTKNVFYNTGDSLTPQVGYSFSTVDQDNDIYEEGSCALLYKGAWWYQKCHASNLNGEYKIGGDHESYADGIEWLTLKGHYYSFKTVEMKLRPADFYKSTF